MTQRIPTADDVRRNAQDLWTWMRADPKNFARVFALVFGLVEGASQVHWHRTHGYRAVSIRGSIAYAKAKPLRVTVDTLVSWSPQIIALIQRRGGQD
ncbi:hypothetical protein JOE57_000667 [Microlunatus panaciterrae]|uniref:Uncharacterized protein n=1 Tax=Microlunatus panaciterrae TaxID=400768 RepID=A0ABS2RHR7_9ACTN|nr:hypothetical protein [Microlunatus panaciterrae]MBM7797746.1 hypothetical protein [Microlunatus panaciterrae]